VVSLLGQVTGRYAKSGKFAYYVCNTLEKKGACKAKYYNAEEFEKVVVEQLLKHILTPENLSELMDLANQELESLEDSRINELIVITDAINDINEHLGHLNDAVETGKLDLGDIALRIKELRLRQEKLHSHKNEIENELSDKLVEPIDMETMTHYVSEIQEIIEGSLANKKAFIRGFAKDIRVTGDEAVMNYSLPSLLMDNRLDFDGVPRTV
jgi:site-specific DNA recombinase